MAQFRSKEEYEKWKTDKLNKPSIAEPSAPSKDKQKYKQYFFITVGLFSLFVIGVVLFFFFGKTNQSKPLEQVVKPKESSVLQQPQNPVEQKTDEANLRNQEYFNDGSKALAELEKLSATLSIGITPDDYVRKLGEANYQVSSFVSKYEGSPDSSGALYKVVKFGRDAYAALSEKWQTSMNLTRIASSYDSSNPAHKIIIDTSTKHFIAETQNHIKRGWAIISQLLKSTRKAIDEKNEEKKKAQLQEITTSFRSWDEEEANFQKQLDSYKKSIDIVSDDLMKAKTR